MWREGFAWVFDRTPPGMRGLLRRLKYLALGRLSPARYWDLASSVSPTAAICTDCLNEAQFFELGKREAVLLRNLGLLGPEVRVIDVGCGMGRVEWNIRGEVKAVVGVDVSSRMVRLARQKVTADNVRFEVGDGKSLSGFASESFDLCFSFLVFQHIPRPAVRSYFREILRVLKPGGSFLFQLALPELGVDAEPPPEHPFGMRYYPVEAARELLEEMGFVLAGRYNLDGRAPRESEEHDKDFQHYLARKPAVTATA